MQNNIEIRPYAWEGLYADWRSDAPHDPGLCAAVSAPWMGPDERLILRACEIIGYPEAYFYDDHYPPADAEGRGKNYRHRNFTWDAQSGTNRLTARCTIPETGYFALDFRAQDDYVDIVLTLRNDLPHAVGPVDWAFCAIALESPTLRNPEQDHLFLFDGTSSRSLRELGGDNSMRIYSVAGGEGFVPCGHTALAKGPIEAQRSVVVLESSDERYCAALGFEQAYSIFGCRGNMCFHADPYFGMLRSREEKVRRGRLYLIEGNKDEAFARYERDFAPANAAFTS